jgi:hypothetical protein
MAEEKQQHIKSKKWGLVRRIVRGIFIATLAVLLASAIFFEAPWKVTGLIVVFLFACAILPRRARKWFWAGVAGAAIALVIWVLLPDKNGNWRPYTLDEDLAKLEAKYAIPDEENAAVIYNRLLADYEPNSIRPDFLSEEIDDLTARQPWSAKDYPELAQWLQQRQQIIATLLEAAKKEKCHFPIAADPLTFGKQTEHLSPMRRWAWFLIRAANHDLGEDHVDQALDKYTCVLQMAKHQYQQPTLIDLLTGIAIEGIVTKQLNSFVITDDAASGRLGSIEEALAGIEHDWPSDWLGILEHEKLFAKGMWAMFFEINSASKTTRLARDPTAAMRTQLPPDLPQEYPRPTYLQKRFLKAKTILGWFFMPSTPQKAAEIIDASYARLYAMASPFYDWKKEPINFKFSLRSVKFNFPYMSQMLVSLLEPTSYRFHDIYLRAIAQQRAARLIIALRRYKDTTGAWPENLELVRSLAPAEAFVDPTNGDAFVYRLTDENFTLYSKGKNGIDDGGIRTRGSDEKGGADDIRIWPPETRTKSKTQQEKADVEQ